MRVVRNFERDAVGLIANIRRRNSRFIFRPIRSCNGSRCGRFTATFERVEDFSAYVSRRLTSLPNVSLFDFRDAKEVTHDLNNYGDVIHHSPAVDLKVLSWLAAGDYLVDRAAPTASLDRLKAQVAAYRVEEIGQQ